MNNENNEKNAVDRIVEIDEDKTIDPNSLDYFTGSENFYRHGLVPSILLTEGAMYLNQRGAGWLMDLIVSWQFDKHVNAELFQVWDLITNLSAHTATAICTDGNGNELTRQYIEYTDFPMPKIRLYFINDIDHQTILLPSEY